jgi:hypothetical protein
MTQRSFPLDPPYRFETEAPLAQRCTEVLREAGWHVTVFAAHRSVPPQMQGWPDIVAFRRDVTLLIECKAPLGTLREEQRVFQEAVWPETGPHLHYVELRDLRQLEVRWISPLRS